MTDQLYQGPLYVKKSPIHGYGVFAAEDLPKDVIIEECHTLLTRHHDSAFKNYYFNSYNNKIAIPLGYACIYNHSDKPNVAYYYNEDKQIIIFETLRDIRKGEELFSSYGKHWFSQRKMKVKSPRWWRRLYRSLIKIPLRFALLYAAYRVYLYGLYWLAQ